MGGPEDPLLMKQIDYETLSIPGRIDFETSCKEQCDIPLTVGEKRLCRPEIFGQSQFEVIDDFLSIEDGGLYSSKRARHY
jgi:hypothetical protein